MQKAVSGGPRYNKIPLRKAGVRLVVYGALQVAYIFVLLIVFVALAGVQFVEQHSTTAFLALLLPVCVVILPAIFLDVLVRFHPEMQATKNQHANDFARKELLKRRRKENLPASEVNAFLVRERELYLDTMTQLGILFGVLAVILTAPYAVIIGLLARVASINVLTAISLVLTIGLLVWLFVEYKRGGNSFKRLTYQIAFRGRFLIRH